MPSLHICGRPTFLAGDDLRTPTLMAILLRLCQIVVLIPLTYFTANRSGDFEIKLECSETYKRPRLVDHVLALVVTYVSCSFVLAVLGILLELAIYSQGRRGTPTQPQLRRLLIPLCNVKFIPFTMMRVANIAIGFLSIAALNQYCKCGTQDLGTECERASRWHVWLRVLAVTQLIELCFIGIVGLYFLCKWTPGGLSGSAKWRVACQCCCTVTSVAACCLLGGGCAGHGPGDLADISRVLSHHMDAGGTVDVVLSDVVVGLRMLARVQRKRQLECRSRVMRRASMFTLVRAEEESKDSEEGEPAEEIDLVDDDELDVGPELLASLSPSVAERGGGAARDDVELAVSPDRMMERKKSVVFRPFRQGGQIRFQLATRRVLSRRNQTDRIALAEGARFMRYAMGIYDFVEILKGCAWQCCRQPLPELYKEALASVGLEEAEMVYFNHREGIAETPYCIAIDREWREVVVAIRGTASLDDVVTDLTMRPVSMEDWGERCGFDGMNCHVHAGMLKRAEWIFDDLERHRELDRLLSTQHSSEYLEGYRLRLCGHSLGAGVTCILSFLLKSKFPDLRCSCYCPPGCSVSENMAEICKEYLTSYVLDSDIVPRITFEAFSRLTSDMLDAIARIKVTKFEATHAKPGIEELDRLLCPEDSVPASEFRDSIDRFHAYREKKRKRSRELHIQLFPPGNILHLYHTIDDARKKGCFSCRSAEGGPEATTVEYEYAAGWAERSDFAEILISSHAVSDHSSPNVLEALERTAEVFGLSPPFTKCESNRIESSRTESPSNVDE